MGALHFLHHISDQDRARRLEFALEGAGLGVWDWDLETNEVFFDRRWCEMLGMDPKETDMSIATWESRVHPDDIAQCYRDIQAHLRGETAVYENIHRMRHADGRWIYILDRGRLSGWNAEGKPTRFTGTHFDVTVTEEANRILESKAHTLSELVRIMPNAVAMVNREMKYVAVSESWLADYRLKWKSIVGRCHYEIFPEIGEAWKKIHKRAMQGETVSNERDPFLRADGTTQWLKWTCRPWADEDGSVGGILMMSEDITLAIEMETKLHQDSRLAALGHLAGGIAHEINNPLSIIRGNAELLQAWVKKLTAVEPKAVQNIERIIQTTDRIEKIIRALRSISSGHSEISLGRFRFSQIMQDVLEVSSIRLKALGIRIETHFEETGEDHIWMDGSQISQILLNLMNNSIDAVESLPEKWIRIETETHPDFYLLRFIDSGHGLSDTVTKKIFNPFFTTKEVGKGTGLGLSLSLAYARQHSGDLSYRLLDGHTCFELKLDRHLEPSPVRPD